MTSNELGWWAVAEEGVAAAMNKRGRAHRCKPLLWSIGTVANPEKDSPMPFIAELTGMAGAEHPDEETRTILAAWARLLGIESEPKESVRGTIEYSGHLAAHRLITLWGVVDRAAWDARKVGQ